ncbi:hypothetical protein ACLSSQ_16990 [Azospira sp. APE16]|uniref:hypothetical protein n=1 Tax=Azospira sp. APE16 TaxID=3394231 RepID=UPI003A4DC802
MTTTDWLILAPILPLSPVLATWFLPWERWLPWSNVPKLVSGPYLFYGAFVAHWFKAPGWAVLVVFLCGFLVCVSGLKAYFEHRAKNIL